MTDAARIRAHDRGWAAQGDGTPYSGNPFGYADPSLRSAWQDGWNEADDAARAAAEERETELMDAVRNAAMDLPEGPISRFADAVVAWMESRP